MWVQARRSVCWASLQPGPQRLAGLVKLADTVYEDLQSCYGIYASLFHRWGQRSPCCPCIQPLKFCRWTGEQGEQMSEVCPLQHHQDRLLHPHLSAAGASGEEVAWGEPPGWEGTWVSCCWQSDSTLLGRWLKRCGC